MTRAVELLTHPGGSIWVGPIAEGRASVELWRRRPESAAALVSEGLEQVRGREHVFYSARLYELGARACAELASVPGDHPNATGRLLSPTHCSTASMG